MKFLYISIILISLFFSFEVIASNTLNIIDLKAPEIKVKEDVPIYKKRVSFSFYRGGGFSFSQSCKFTATEKFYSFETSEENLLYLPHFIGFAIGANILFQETFGLNFLFLINFKQNIDLIKNKIFNHFQYIEFNSYQVFLTARYQFATKYLTLFSETGASYLAYNVTVDNNEIDYKKNTNEDLKQKMFYNSGRDVNMKFPFINPVILFGGIVNINKYFNISLEFITTIPIIKARTESIDLNPKLKYSPKLLVEISKNNQNLSLNEGSIIFNKSDNDNFPNKDCINNEVSNDINKTNIQSEQNEVNNAQNIFYEDLINKIYSKDEVQMMENTGKYIPERINFRLEDRVRFSLILSIVFNI